MTTKVVLRSGKDRLRYAISFEMLLMVFLIPAGAIFFDKPMAEIGALGVALAVKAMLLNLIYNWVFDRIDAKAGRVSSQRSTLGRLLHAVGFDRNQPYFDTISDLICHASSPQALDK